MHTVTGGHFAQTFLRTLCHYYCEKSLEYDVNALWAQQHDATPDGRATAGLHTKVSQQEPTAIRTKVHWHRDGAQVKIKLRPIEEDLYPGGHLVQIVRGKMKAKQETKERNDV